MAGALEGCRILDFTRVLSGPWCTMFLSDLGAEVVKVEEPRSGDHSRGYGPPFLNGESVYFMSYNRGKQSITLNLNHPRGRELVRALASKVDVLIQNYQRGWAYQVGLDYESLKEVNPRLVYCWISAYGEEGPYAEKGSGDIMVMGLSGAMSVTGEPDGPPIKSNISFADILAGTNAAVGILAALRVRDQTGQGQKVSVNLLDSAVSVLGSLAGIYFATGQAPRRIAPDVHPSMFPSGTFRTKDGYINLGGSRDKEFPNLCRALGIHHLAEDPRFTTNPARVKNRQELRRLIEDALSARTTAEWVAICNGHGVMAEPVNTIEEAFAHPQVLHNQIKQTIPHPTAGTVAVLRMPLRLSATPLRMQAPPPRLGEHTEAVLARYLGLGQDEMSRLHQQGVT